MFITREHHVSTIHIDAVWGHVFVCFDINEPSSEAEVNNVECHTIEDVFLVREISLQEPSLGEHNVLHFQIIEYPTSVVDFFQLVKHLDA